MLRKHKHWSLNRRKSVCRSCSDVSSECPKHWIHLHLSFRWKFIIFMWLLWFLAFIKLPYTGESLRRRHRLKSLKMYLEFKEINLSQSVSTDMCFKHECVCVQVDVISTCRQFRKLTNGYFNSWCYLMLGTLKLPKFAFITNKSSLSVSGDG